MTRQKEQEDWQKNRRGDRKGESNNSPEIPDRRVTSGIPGIPSGWVMCIVTRGCWDMSFVSLNFLREHHLFSSYPSFQFTKQNRPKLVMSVSSLNNSHRSGFLFQKTWVPPATVSQTACDTRALWLDLSVRGHCNCSTRFSDSVWYMCIVVTHMHCSLICQ